MNINNSDSISAICALYLDIKKICQGSKIKKLDEFIAKHKTIICKYDLTGKWEGNIFVLKKDSMNVAIQEAMKLIKYILNFQISNGVENIYAGICCTSGYIISAEIMINIFNTFSNLPEIYVDNEKCSIPRMIMYEGNMIKGGFMDRPKLSETIECLVASCYPKKNIEMKYYDIFPKKIVKDFFAQNSKSMVIYSTSFEFQSNLLKGDTYATTYCTSLISMCVALNKLMIFSPDFYEDILNIIKDDKSLEISFDINLNYQILCSVSKKKSNITSLPLRLDDSSIDKISNSIVKNIELKYKPNQIQDSIKILSDSLF
jgi:hypothetical protein